MVAGWPDFLRDDPTDWLLEEDNPSVRYLTLRSLLDLDEAHSQVVPARQAIMNEGPVPAILAAQHPDGYWFKPGHGYSPKYRSTVWQVIFLAELAADGSDEQVAKACEYVLTHSRTKSGAFTATKDRSGAVDCLNGNMIHAFYRLGWGADERVGEAVQELAGAVASRHFECGPNGRLPCAWGAVKALLAFSAMPLVERVGPVKAAIDEGVAFLLSRNLAVGDYPCSKTVSSNWQKFGFPLSYTSNILEALNALARLGHGSEPGLRDAIRHVLWKQDEHGRWRMETSLNGKMWVDIEAKGKPSKWVTFQALQMLKRVFGGN